ncbi:MAG TPA: ThiF family adenylyltransferase [Actinocrinis sp.]|nr:ThiF family adenylyltransferase [Actinocrinis sp.]
MDLDLTPGQKLAFDQLTDLATRSDNAIDIVRPPLRDGAKDTVEMEISLDCSGIATAPTGIAVRARERFILTIDPAFPFTVPQVRVPHTRWAGVAHVQWGSTLCLYIAPSVEWVPADGMRGLIDRLAIWIRRAGTGDLDPDDQPLHPPVAYTSAAAGVALTGPDLLPPTDAAPVPGFLVAVCSQPGDQRVDVEEWITLSQWAARYQTSEISGGLDEANRRVLGAVTLLLDRDIGFEYPDGGEALLRGLADAGMPPAALFDHLHRVAVINERLDEASAAQGLRALPRPALVFLGTPSRRVQPGATSLTHLVAWRIDEEGRRVLTGQNPEGVQPLLQQASVTWVPVLERRPEVTRRRDADTSGAWLIGKRVLVLGCGALGAPAAQICVRAGAAEVTVADIARVTPGVLVRQPYTDADIGRFKAQALADQLNAIHGGMRVAPIIGNVIPLLLNDGFDPSHYDLVIDAAADAAVTSRLEERRAALPGPWPPIVTLLIGHDARRGLVACALGKASGGGRDILRRVGIAAHGAKAHQLADVAEDFFPETARHDLFQPEPGCSAPTFTGSAAETGALAAHMMSAALDAVSGLGADPDTHPLQAAVVRLEPGTIGTQWLCWPADLVNLDESTGFAVRISAAALREIRAETVRGARVRGRGVETGGMLLGEIDDACRCVWIDTATAPPPDSTLSAHHFEHGLDGTEQLLDYHRHRSGQSSAFIGMWHTHPDHRAQPSPTDIHGMNTLVGHGPLDTPRAVLMILGGSSQQWSDWLDTGTPPQLYTHLVQTTTRLAARQAASRPDAVEGSWPGGYLTTSISRPTARRRRRWSRLRRPWRAARDHGANR